MKTRIIKRISCFVVATTMMIWTFATQAVFAFDENKISLNIDTTTIEVKNAWAQIKNAAVVQLVAQKFKKCIEIGQVMQGYMRPRYETTLQYGVLDNGDIFTPSAFFSGDYNTNIAVGPYISRLFREGDSGEMTCNSYTGSDSSLFDLFVYVMKNYKAGLDAASLVNAAASESDRLEYVCNGTTYGLLIAADNGWVYDTPNYDADCSTAEWYLGMNKDWQSQYVGGKYDAIVRSSDNDYIPSWSELGTYAGEPGYYLYSLDFSVQCGGATFVDSPGSDNGYTYKKGYQIDDSSGKVSEGYYKISNNSSAKPSFVGGPKTCGDLVDKMNEHISKYIQFVNSEVYGACKDAINEEIDKKKQEIDEKYLNNERASEEQKADANLVLEEYSRIQGEKEYVATKDDEEKEVLRNTSNGVPGNEARASMPTEYIWTCRSHLPFVDVVAQREDDLADVIEDEFYDACYDAVDLAWVVCPIINGVSNIVDELRSAVEGFF